MNGDPVHPAAIKRSLLEGVNTLVRTTDPDAAAKALSSTLDNLSLLVNSMFEKEPGKVWVVTLQSLPEKPEPPEADAPVPEGQPG